jgi:hypothetical protein
MTPSLVLLCLVIALVALAWALLLTRNRRQLPPARPPVHVTLREAQRRERPPSTPPALLQASEPEVVEPAREPLPPAPEVLPPQPALLPPLEPSEKPIVDEPTTTLAPPTAHRPAPPWYPIVLAHGVLGFDALPLGFLHPAYFRGVAETLRKAGNEVHVIRVSPVAGIAVRAAQLARQIRDIPAERVNIVAHSMGGLDARYAISVLGLGDRVASLTTIGTPHHGTPLADTVSVGCSRFWEWTHFGS